MKKESIYKKLLKSNYGRKNSLFWLRENRDSYESTPRVRINSQRRPGYYHLYIKDRVFNHNMIDGLCFGNFYGRQKIIFKRKR